MGEGECVFYVGRNEMLVGRGREKAAGRGGGGWRGVWVGRGGGGMVKVWELWE